MRLYDVQIPAQGRNGPFINNNQSIDGRINLTGVVVSLKKCGPKSWTINTGGFFEIWIKKKNKNWKIDTNGTIKKENDTFVQIDERTMDTSVRVSKVKSEEFLYETNYT
jgi:hypothetical protein